jgi:hypothetical protein
VEKDEDEGEGEITPSTHSPPLKTSPRLTTSSASKWDLRWRTPTKVLPDRNWGILWPTTAVRSHAGIFCLQGMSVALVVSGITHLLEVL